MRERSSQGAWREAAQLALTFSPALHDPQALVDALGGPGRFGAKLDEFFLQLQPNDHAEWLYAWTDAPWKGHQLTRKSGSIFAALGFYPVVVASGRFVLGAPLVPRAELHWPDGRVFRIRADGYSPLRPYAQTVQLNGRKMAGFELSYDEIRAGGELVFTMVPAPAVAGSTCPSAAAAPAKATNVSVISAVGMDCK